MTPIEIAAPLVRKSEGLRLVAYICPAGKLTIGYGHTGKDVKPGMKITAERAEGLLMSDLAAAGVVIARLVKVKLSAHQEAALLDFVFNFGAENFRTSTLLRRLNDGLYSHVPDQLTRWVYGTDPKTGKKVQMAGLKTRRAAEVVLWGTP